MSGKKSDNIALREDLKDGAGYPSSTTGRESRTREKFSTENFYSWKSPLPLTIWYYLKIDIKELQKKALHIIDLYGEQDRASGHPSDSVESRVMQFVSDVGDLSRYITKYERGEKNDDFHKNISRELGECLAAVLVLANHYNVNLEEAFLKENNRLEQILKSKG